MFVRVLWRAGVVRKESLLTALLAVAVAAAVGTATLNLYVDTQAKLEREFRGYGANLLIVARASGQLPEAALRQTDIVLAGKGIAVPFAYGVAKTLDGAPIVVAGVDFDRVRMLNKWWSVSGWPLTPDLALVGSRAAVVLTPHGEPFDLAFNGKVLRVKPAGTLTTGADEESRVYLPMAAFEKWTGLRPTTIEVAATGSSTEIEAVRQRLAAALPAAQVTPVRQIVEAEARVLGKTRATLFASSAVIILTVALCVLATLTARVLDQRKNFAIMKALGAPERLIVAFFATEAALLGAVGAAIGFAAGIGIAAWIGRVNFHASVVPRWSILPAVVAGSIVVALISAVLPISLLRRIHPADILRGE
jgi:putative ABC transport system permease protein